MIKRVTIGGILTVVILFFAFGATPDENVTDSKSAINSAKQGLVVDTTIDAGSKSIDIASEQAIESACKDGSSQGCSTVTNSVTMIGVAFTILIIGIIFAAAVGFVKFVINVLESF